MWRRAGIYKIIWGISCIIIGSILIVVLWDVSWIFRGLSHVFTLGGLGFLIRGIKLIIGERK